MTKSKITVVAQSCFLPEQSILENNRFLWSYEMIISNEGDEIVQLLNRYWRITEMSGHIEEVRGPGVVGLQPIIKPGKKFSYTSFCQLTTPQGTMEGYYEMQTLNDENFHLNIPKFLLSSPMSISSSYRSRLH